MTAVALTTARLSLRPLTLDDAAPTAALMTLDVAKWTGTWPAPVSEAFVAERIRRTLEAVAGGMETRYAVIRREDGALIGWAGLAKADAASDEAVLGFWLGADFQGRGYGAEAATAALADGWTALGLARAIAWAQAGNAASIGALRKLGMHYLRTEPRFAQARGAMEVCELYQLERPGA